MLRWGCDRQLASYDWRIDISPRGANIEVVRWHLVRQDNRANFAEVGRSGPSLAGKNPQNSPPLPLRDLLDL